MKKDSLPLGSLADELIVAGKTHHECQCHYAFGIHSILTEVDKRGLEGTQSSLFQLQLLASRGVDDICGATVVHKDSPGGEPLYYKHYN